MNTVPLVPAKRGVIHAMRFMIVTLFSLVLVLTGPVIGASAATTPNVTVVFAAGSRTYTVNGKAQTMDVAPFVDVGTGRAYVPVRYLAGALGVSPQGIGWNAATGAVTLSLQEEGGGRDIVLGLVIGSKTLTVTNRPGSQGIQAQFVAVQKVQMDAAPEIVDDRTMVPARWVVQALGYSLQWEQTGQRLVITG